MSVLAVGGFSPRSLRVFGHRCTVGIGNVSFSGHDHVTSLCLSLPLVAFDPGAYGYSGIGALLALAISHSAVMTTSLLYVCPCHWWPLTRSLRVFGHRCTVGIGNVSFSGHDHVTSLCLSLPLVAFDPGAYGYSGIGALFALAMSHSAVMTTSLLYVCPCHWWPLTPEPTGIRASVHCWHWQCLIQRS